jgi:hypothetical protein
MYLAMLTLPLLGSIFSGFFGRKVGVIGAQFITCFSVITTTALAILAFFNVILYRAYSNLEWFFNCPPKPHPFFLPVKSCIDCAGLLDACFHIISKLNSAETIQYFTYAAQALIRASYSAANGASNLETVHGISIGALQTVATNLFTGTSSFSASTFLCFTMNMYSDYIEYTGSYVNSKMVHSFFKTGSTVLAYYAPGLGIEADFLSYFASNWSTFLQPNDARYVEYIPHMVAKLSK